MRGRFFCLIIVLATLAVVMQPAAWGYRESAHLAKTSVGFQLYRNYLIVIQGSVGPLKGLNFLLDTGANTTVLDPRLAQKLHLDATPTSVAVPSGRAEGGIGAIPSLRFGPIHKDNIRVFIMDLSFLQHALPIQIDGILGLDVLGQSTFVIDYSSRKIRFSPASPMPDSIPLQLEDGLAFVDAVVNHTRVRLLVDTGAPSMIIFEEVPNWQSGPKGDDAQPSPRPSSTKIGDFERKRERQISFSLGAVEFGHESALVASNHKDAGHDFDGMMSPVALGITRVEVNLTQRTLAFARKP
jgi:hypothetical protein